MISKLILGTAQLGLDYGINNTSGKPSMAESLAILTYASQHGIDTLDTADAYGEANKIIGSYNLNHSKYNVINKISKSGGSQKESIKRVLLTLGIPSFKVLHFHSFSDFFNFPEMLQDMKELKEERLIEKIGLSIYSNKEMEVAINNESIDVIQLPFSLLDNYKKRGKMIDAAKTAGKEVHVRSIFLQGLLFMDPDNVPEKIRPLTPYLQSLHKLALQHSLNIHTIALNYALLQPGIDRVILGVETLAQLQDNLDRVNQYMSPDLIHQINEIDVIEEELLLPSYW